MARIGQQAVGNIQRRVRNPPERAAQRQPRRRHLMPPGQEIARGFVLRLPLSIQQRQAKGGIADAAGDEHRIARARAVTPHHRALRHKSECGDGQRQRSRRCRGIAAIQRYAEHALIGSKPICKSVQPIHADIAGQRQREQIAACLRPLRCEVGEIDPQRLPRHAVRRRVGKKMHARHQRVGGDNDLVAVGGCKQGRIIAQPQRARRPRRQRREQFRDQGEFMRALGHAALLPRARTTSVFFHLPLRSFGTPPP